MPSRACAAAMSSTSSAGPATASVPATRKRCHPDGPRSSITSPTHDVQALQGRGVGEDGIGSSIARRSDVASTAAATPVRRRPPAARRCRARAATAPRRPTTRARRDVELDHRAGHAHRFVARQRFDQRVVEAFARARGDRQVGVAVGGAHGAGKLRQRRGVDQMHGECQRHPHRDGQCHGRMPPRMQAPFRQRQRAQVSTKALQTWRRWYGARLARSLPSAARRCVDHAGGLQPQHAIGELGGSR